MKLYGIKACDTCRKALRALASAGHDVEFMDVRATPLDEETLTQFLTSFGSDLVNRRSTTWRGLNDDERAQSDLELLQAHPALLKRPVIQTDDGAFTLGWTKDVQSGFGLV